MEKHYKRLVFLAIALIFSCKAMAISVHDVNPTDTIMTHELDEIAVIGSSSIMRQAGTLNKIPATFSLITPIQIRQLDIKSIADLTSIVPNFYMPDYGSRLTSAIYVRGIGSRSSGQTIGVYIDGVPLLNKAGFNFDMQNIASIAVQNGPQGTLYGRNAMGGIINLTTHSAIDNPGAHVLLRGGNYNTFRAQTNIRQKLSEKTGLTMGAYYSKRGGYFKNVFNNTFADSETDGGANIKLEHRGLWGGIVAFETQFDHTNQGAFPYMLLDKEQKIHDVNYNDPGNYKRNMLTNRLRYTREWNSFVLESATGYSYLSDKMLMDQDYTPANAFTIRQDQHMHNISQEFIIKNTSNERYDWNFGLFGFYTRNDMRVPVEFKPDGIRMVLQRSFDKLNAANIMPVILQADASKSAFNNNHFIKPDLGVAIYHQSTLKDLFTKGLSVTAGLRLDYERQALDYYSDVNFRVGITPRRSGAKTIWYEKPTVLEGNHHQSSFELLPKLSIMYEHGQNNYYASVSRGYKAGGYSEQMMSEAVQLAFQKQLKSMGKEEANGADYIEGVRYKPEHAINYEVGMRSKLFNNRLQVSANTYYTQISDIQLTQFVASGAGRVITNAGKAQNYGAELSLHARLVNSLTASINYGYTHATFKNYFKESNMGGKLTRIDFAGKYIPYIPRHTYNATLNFNEPLAKKYFIDYLFGSVSINGAGPIYWDESNTIKQDSYYNLNVRGGIRLGHYAIAAWANNVTNQKYSVFFFSSFGNSFLQQCPPFRFGIDLTYDL